jgi:hypothetical protein
MMWRHVYYLMISLVVVGCGGGGSSGGGSDTPAKTWGNTPLAERQAHLKSYSAVLLHRIHPRAAGETPNHWPFERFMDVWQREGQTVARFEYKLGANDPDPMQYFVTLQGVESTATTLFDFKTPHSVWLAPVQTILGSAYDNVRGVYQDDAYWDAQGKPHVLWSYNADNQGGDVSDYSSIGGGTGKGQLTFGFKNGGTGRIYHLKGQHYGFGCNIYGAYVPPDYPDGSGETRSDAWMMRPDMAWPRDNTPTYLHNTLGRLIFGAESRKPFAPAGCAFAMADQRLLLAYAYNTESSLAGSQYRGKMALVGFDGTDYQLIAQSDAIANSVWAPTYGAPRLMITTDSTDPTRPYVLAIYQYEQRVPTYNFRSEIRVFQLDGNQLKLRYTAQVNSLPQSGLTDSYRSLVVHRGQLIVERYGSKGRELVVASGNGLMQPYKSGLLMDQFDYMTFMKSEAGKLYMGIQRAEFQPYRHDLAELIRIDD